MHAASRFLPISIVLLPKATPRQGLGKDASPAGHPFGLRTRVPRTRSSHHIAAGTVAPFGTRATAGPAPGNDGEQAALPACQSTLILLDCGRGPGLRLRPPRRPAWY